MEVDGRGFQKGRKPELTPERILKPAHGYHIEQASRYLYAAYVPQKIRSQAAYIYTRMIYWTGRALLVERMEIDRYDR